MPGLHDNPLFAETLRTYQKDDPLLSHGTYALPYCNGLTPFRWGLLACLSKPTAFDPGTIIITGHIFRVLIVIDPLRVLLPVRLPLAFLKDCGCGPILAR